jgi:formylglycine-generating enzyme required for sulfatase activity
MREKCGIPLGLCLLLLALAGNISRAEVVYEWVTVGDPGNLPDDTGNGAVAEPYRIGRYEVTNSQYVEFLNAVAADDPNLLYIPEMTNMFAGGILRTGEPGAYRYSVRAGRENRPAVYITLWNAMRFANWMQNGQPAGNQGPETTEDGAYTMTPDGVANTTITRNAGATVFVPSDDQWYKAAYYKSGGIDAGYWDYPTQSDEVPSANSPPGGSNSANYGAGRDHTEVGSYILSSGPYGTFDQGGNAWEWTEEVWGVNSVLMRGGSVGREAQRLSADWAGSHSPNHGLIGFRLASTVPLPEPTTGMLLLLGLGLWSHCRHRSRSGR